MPDGVAYQAVNDQRNLKTVNNCLNFPWFHFIQQPRQQSGYRKRFIRFLENKKNLFGSISSHLVLTILGTLIRDSRVANEVLA